MIVRNAAGRIQLITQPAHAALARRIMERCALLAGGPRREVILRAIGEHDNGWVEEDAVPGVLPGTGAIADFVALPAVRRQAVWPRGVGRLADDPWAAALVAQHAIAVYDRFRPDPEWSAFFAGMEAMRNRMVRASGLPFENLAADYRFLRLGDLISLAFCTGAAGEQQFGGWTVRLSGARVLVEPEAFGDATIPIEVAAREIPDRPYRSDAELQDALRIATTTTLRGEVAG